MVDRDDDWKRWDEILTGYAGTYDWVCERGPAEAIGRLVTLCERAPDVDHLGVLAVAVLDALLDEHWAEVGPVFEAAMRASSALRRCWSCAMADIPQNAIDRLDALLMPGEDIGH